MKITAGQVLLIVLTMSVSFARNGFSQEILDRKVTLELGSSSLRDALIALEAQAKVKFVYSASALELTEQVTLNVSDQKLSDVLDILLEPLSITYVVKGAIHIVLKPVKDKSKGKDSDDLLIGMYLVEVTGNISDASTGAPLPGVNVILKGTTVGTVTDVDGNYSLNVTDLTGTLIFSYIGYVTQEHRIENRSMINISMAQDVTALEEVVVVGYGTQKKSHLTAAVDQVDGEVLQNRPLRSVADGLQGMVAGLNIRAPSGAPEATPRLNIRGFTGFGTSGAPLILVDGVERELSDINPNDIESISVLKDGAASAIYGSRAPFGIVLITTKSGKKGEEMRIGYSTNLSYGRPYGLPEFLDSHQWATYINGAFRNEPGGGGAPFFSDLQIQRMQAFAAGDFGNPAFDGLDHAHVPYGTFALTPTLWGGHTEAFANTDWFEESMHDLVSNQQHNINVSGGGEKTSYYVGLGYYKNGGVFKGPNFNDRYSALFKVDTDVTDWLSINVSTNYVRNLQEGPNYQGQGRNYAAIFNTFARSFPSWSTINPNGSTYRFNAMPLWNGEAGTESLNMNRLLLSGGVSINPFKGFNVSGRYTLRNTSNNFQRLTLQAFQTLPNGVVATTQRTAGNTALLKQSGDEIYHTADIHASYTHTLNDLHNFYILAGYQEEENRFDMLQGSATGLFSPSVPTLSTSGDNFQTSDQLYHWATRGLFGRFSYNYAEKYFIEFNARRDANSRFRREDRWGFFPSVSAAWNIARENFWPGNDVITLLKPRGSWTTSGNAILDTNVPVNERYYPFYPAMDVNVSNNIILGGALASFASMPVLVSDELTWAKPTTINVGLDMQAFEDRMELNYDWYQRTVRDQFGPPPTVPKTIGASVPNANNAVSETRGWELNLKWRDRAFDLMEKPFHYFVNFRMSDYVGYVVEYEDNGTGTRNGQWTPGEVFGQNFHFASKGIMQNREDLYANVPQGTTWYYPGDLAMQDLNGDGEINSGTTGTWYSMGDVVKNGFNYPRKSYGVTLGVEWNNFDVSLLVDGVGHWKEYASNMYIWGNSGQIWFAPQYKEHADLGYWLPGNTDAFFPRNTYNGKNRNTPSDQYALDLSHLRIRNLKLGYSIPETLLGKMGMNRLYLYMSAENLGFVYYNSFIKYDPELISASGGEGYPPFQYFSFGINVEL